MIRRRRLSEIRNGDIFLHSGTGLMSRAVRFFTRSWWSHCGIVALGKYVAQPEPETLYTIEALNHIESQYFSTYAEDMESGRVVVYGFPESVDNACIDDCVAIQATKLGREYDWIGSAALAVLDPLQRALWSLGLNVTIPSPFRTPEEKCSELVLDYLWDIYNGTQNPILGYMLRRVLDRETFTPNDLALLIQRNKK